MGVHVGVLEYLRSYETMFSVDFPTDLTAPYSGTPTTLRNSNSTSVFHSYFVGDPILHSYSFCTPVLQAKTVNFHYNTQIHIRKVHIFRQNPIKSV